jgi:hypothetical protein
MQFQKKKQEIDVKRVQSRLPLGLAERTIILGLSVSFLFSISIVYVS